MMIESNSTIEQANHNDRNLTSYGWRESRQLLHLYAQIIGKIKLKLHPKLNHWWHATLSISSVGWTTGLIPCENGCFEMEFNFLSHELVIKKSDGRFRLINLHQPSIKAFHDELFTCLLSLDITVVIDEHPYDPAKVKTNIPFNVNHTPVNYDPFYAYNLWQSFVEADVAFQKFKGRFIGKSSPVQLFWHSFDLALTFFSGKQAPFFKGMNKVAKEAYSHEVISFGFWSGDDDIDEPAYYSYVYPEPKDLISKQLMPREAYWKNLSRGSLAILPYQSLENHQPREQAILDFLESSFYAGITSAHWDGENSKLLSINMKKHHFIN